MVRPLKRYAAVFAVVALMAALGLAPQGASAATSTSQLDDPGANTPQPFLKAVGQDRAPNDPGGPAGCDTINPVITTNRNLIAYNNRDFSTTNIRSCVGEADITGWSVTSDVAAKKIVWTITTRSNIPDEGAELGAISNGGTSFGYNLYFQNAAMQNRRQRVGDSLDCTRGTYQGPFLTGNGEYFYMFWSITVDATGQKFGKPAFGFGHYDSIGNLGYQTRFGSPDVNNPSDLPVSSQKCSGTPAAHTSVQYPGRGMSYSVSGNTLTVRMPMHYCWVNFAAVINCYDVANTAQSQRLTNLFVTSSAEVWLVRTPDLTGINPALKPTGVANAFILDWAPWTANNLGDHPSQGNRVPGPTCPNFNPSQYFQPDPDGVLAGGTYVNPSRTDLNKEDRQVNPLYGVNNYDAEGSGSVDNDIGPLPDQGHGGSNVCDVLIPTAPGWAGSNVSIDVG